MTKVGFIGLGHMGIPMVQNLLAKNYNVTVFDILPEAIQSVVRLGATGADSIAACVMNADIVFTMLQTGSQVLGCCYGDDGIFSNLKSGALFIDSSSIDVKSSLELHNAAESKKIMMLDAPVSGGVVAATAGTLTFMVGGEKKYFDRAQDVLSVLGKNIIHAGKAGSGVVAKICNNMILGVSMIAVSEAFVLADKLGLDPQKLFEISAKASGQCWSLTQYCPWPNILPDVPSSHGYQAGFTAQMMLKDLKLSQDAASHAQVETPLGKEATNLYQQFVDSDHAQVDFSGIIQMLGEL